LKVGGSGKDSLWVLKNVENIIKKALETKEKTFITNKRLDLENKGISEKQMETIFFQRHEKIKYLSKR